MKKEDNKITLLEAVQLLGINCDTRRISTYIQCPVCGKARTKKMNLNFAKDVYRCAKCGDKAQLTEGGPLSFWMLMTGIQDPKEAARDYYERLGNPAKPIAVKTKEQAEFKEEPMAPIEVRSLTYELLLSLLPLRERHRNSLKERGLTSKQIKEFEYKSTPQDPKAITGRLLLKGASLENVPGFYKDEDGTWTMSDYGSGIMIPQRNSRGQIQGFQIRLDNPGKGGKYIAFSSRDENAGTGAKAFVHFREGVRGCEEVIITEGALKADVISSLSGYPVLSVPGVNSLKRLPRALNALLDKDLCRVRIAYDMDLKENEHVQKARKKLEALLRHLNIPYRSMCWDETYKGLDDYLWAMRKAKIEKTN